MESRKIDAKFSDFELPPSIEKNNATVAIPVSKGLQQKYFFLNLASGKGLTVECPKRGGLLTLDACGFFYHFCTFVMNKRHRFFPRIRTLFQRYHNDISFVEILFKLSKPHGITYIGDQKYLVSLWSSSNYFVMDIKNRSVESQTLKKSVQPSGFFKRVKQAFAVKEEQEIFSTYQFFDKQNRETYFAMQTRPRGQKGARNDVLTRIRKYNWDTGKVTVVWEGNFGEATHYIALSADNKYLGLAQFGDFYDEEKNLIPSKILVLDLRTKKEFWIDNTGWSPSAHIDWDPVDPKICYLSCHNGVITPVDSPVKFFFRKVYKWDIFGPASVHKYEITPEGAKKKGIFTHPEVFRLTIQKVFIHRGRRILACTGFPDKVFFADADTMEFIRYSEIEEKSGKKSVVGSIYPSPDGEKIYLVTTGSFQTIDVETGEVDSVFNLGRMYDPFNHMISISDTDW